MTLSTSQPEEQISELLESFCFSEALAATEAAIAHGAMDARYAIVRALLAPVDSHDLALEQFPIGPPELQNDVLGCRIQLLTVASRYREALALAESSIASGQGSGLLSVTRGRLYAQVGRWDESLIQMQMAAQGAPGNRLIASALHASALLGGLPFGHVEVLGMADRQGEAREAAGAAVANQSEECNARVSYAWASSDLDLDGEAIEQVDLALTTNPRHSWALASKIDFLRFANRYRDARALAEDALRVRPNDPQLRVSYAWALSDLNQDDDATEQVDKALSTYPNYSRGLISRIDFLRLANRYENARTAATNALQLRPNDPGLRVAYARALSADLAETTRPSNKSTSR